MRESTEVDNLETVWDGSMKAPLLPPRETKPDLTWEPPRRLYNRKPVFVNVNVTDTAHVAGVKVNSGN